MDFSFTQTQDFTIFLPKKNPEEKMKKTTLCYLLLLGLFFNVCPGSQTHGQQKDTLSIVAVGDIMMGNNFGVISLPPDDGKSSFLSVQEYFQGHDIVFGNYESTFTTWGKSPKRVNNRNTFAFRTPLHYVEHLKKAGFNIMNIANNHALDMGWEGFQDTRKHLEKNGIRVTGVKNQLTVLEASGIKVGFLGYYWNDNFNNIRNFQSAKNLILRSKKQVDILILSIHGGAEGNKAERTADKDEIFFGTNRGNLVRFSRMAIDNGADLILGHGPHVLRAMEIYKGKVIAYSLGNFLTYGMFSMVSPRELSVILSLTLHKSGELVQVKIVPLVLDSSGPYKGTPRFDSGGRAIKRLNDLAKLDFPGSGLIFDSTGKWVEESVK